MKSIPLSALLPGSVAQSDYYSEKGELLISKGSSVTQRHIDILSARNNLDLFINPSDDVDSITNLLSKDMGRTVARDPMDAEPKPVADIPEETEPSSPINVDNIMHGRQGLIQLSKSAIAHVLDEKFRSQNIIDRPVGPPLKNKTSQIPVSERTEEYKASVSNSYQTALNESQTLLNLLARDKSADTKELERIVKRFMKIFVTDRNILLNISNIKSPSDDHLYHHSLNVCLLAINVAASYGYSEKQVLEVGMGALVHDIGMLLIPAGIRTKTGRLTEDEWLEIQKHPILGLHLLEKLKDMPDRISYIAYQVHERENSTGYPRRRNGLLIHRFAKMVQIADIYEALTSLRPHRPPYLPTDAMHKIIQMSRTGLIPSDAVRAFLEYVSLFPVGSLVELADHRIAKVVHANKNALHQPVVSVLTDKKSGRLQRTDIYQLDLSKNPNIQVVKALPLDFLGGMKVMDGF